MALNQDTLKAALQACFEDVSENKTAAQAAEQMAAAIFAFVSSASVNAPPVTGLTNAGGPVTGSTSTWTIS